MLTSLPSETVMVLALVRSADCAISLSENTSLESDVDVVLAVFLLVEEVEALEVSAVVVVVVVPVDELLLVLVPHAENVTLAIVKKTAAAIAIFLF